MELAVSSRLKDIYNKGPRVKAIVECEEREPFVLCMNCSRFFYILSFKGGGGQHALTGVAIRRLLHADLLVNRLKYFFYYKIFLSIFSMSGQFKLSKLFYVDPRLLPNPHHPNHPATFTLLHWTILKNNIFMNGFDSEHPIIVRLWNKYQTLVRFNKMLLEFPRFPSVTSIVKLDATHIEEGNHRLAIALELKLNHVPVRFQFQKRDGFSKSF
jgi:hypothetical protein